MKSSASKDKPPQLLSSLPEDVKNLIRDYEEHLLKFEKNTKNIDDKAYADNPADLGKKWVVLKNSASIEAKKNLETWELIKPVFCEKTMQGTWRKIKEISKEAPILFAKHILGVLNVRRNVLHNFENRLEQQKLIKKVRKSLSKLEKDILKIEDHRSNGLGMVYFKLLMDRLEQQGLILEMGNKNILEDIEEFDLKNRKRKGTQPHFARKLRVFMEKEFGDPHNEIVATTVSVIFNCNYGANHVTKIRIRKKA